MTPLSRRRHSFVMLSFLVALAVVVVAGARALAPDTARAGGYDYLLAPMTQCGGSNQTDTSRYTGEQETTMKCLHNWARHRAGRRALSANELLYRSSEAKTSDMRRCHEFSHYACGRRIDYHLWRVGYLSGNCWGWGENIAWGTGSNGSPRSIMRRWLNSTPHRENILKSSFRDVGLGARKGTFLGYSGAEVWTAHFGYRC